MILDFEFEQLNSGDVDAGHNSLRKKSKTFTFSRSDELGDNPLATAFLNKIYNT